MKPSSYEYKPNNQEYKASLRTEEYQKDFKQEK